MTGAETRNVTGPSLACFCALGSYQDLSVPPGASVPPHLSPTCGWIQPQRDPEPPARPGQIRLDTAGTVNGETHEHRDKCALRHAP